MPRILRVLEPSVKALVAQPATLSQFGEILNARTCPNVRNMMGLRGIPAGYIDLD
jgi:hypothetical protein